MISTKEFIRRWNREYKLLKPVYCKELNEKVYFTSEGFNHLIYKRGHKRSLNEIRYRLPLISYVTEIIRSGEHIERIKIKEEVIYKNKILAKYFAISKIINNKMLINLKIILKKNQNNEEWIFLSIMGKEETETK